MYRSTLRPLTLLNGQMDRLRFYLDKAESKQLLKEKGNKYFCTVDSSLLATTIGILRQRQQGKKCLQLFRPRRNSPRWSPMVHLELLYL